MPSMPQPPPIDYTCRDCVNTTPGVTTFTHSAGCPHDAAFEAVCQADREWFERHPHAVDYWRPVTWPEIQDLRAAGILPVELGGTLVDFEGQVHVRLVEPPNPGLRARQFHGVQLIVSPE